MLNVGVIGMGALGHAIADRVAAKGVSGAALSAIAGRPRSRDRLDALAQQWGCLFTTEPLQLPLQGAGLVIEAAGVEAARNYAIPLLRAGCDIVLMSSGALIDREFTHELCCTASSFGRRVHLPSGSIAGLDGILSAMESNVQEIRVTSRKHPRALVGAPYLTAASVDLADLKEPQVVFEGTAREAAAGFPANLNVAVTVAMAVGDLDKVRVRIIADPGAPQTIHVIEMAAESGTMTVEMFNRPSIDNPRSSWLAALSALATIRRIASPVQVG